MRSGAGPGTRCSCWWRVEGPAASWEAGQGGRPAPHSPSTCSACTARCSSDTSHALQADQPPATSVKQAHAAVQLLSTMSAGVRIAETTVSGCSSCPPLLPCLPLRRCTCPSPEPRCVETLPGQEELQQPYFKYQLPVACCKCARGVQRRLNKACQSLSPAFGSQVGRVHSNQLLRLCTG